jgi:hypothetical protein
VLTVGEDGSPYIEPPEEPTMPSSDGPATLVQALFVPQDHGRVLMAIHANAASLHASLASSRPSPRAEAILRATAELPGVDEKTRLTLRQLATFLPSLQTAAPAEAGPAMAALSSALESSRSVGEVAAGVKGLLEGKEYAGVPGFGAGLKAALEALRDGAAFGSDRPGAVAKACARGAAHGAIAGAAGTTGAAIGAIVGAIAASAEAVLGES